MVAKTHTTTHADIAARTTVGHGIKGCFAAWSWSAVAKLCAACVVTRTVDAGGGAGVHAQGAGVVTGAAVFGAAADADARVAAGDLAGGAFTGAVDAAGAIGTVLITSAAVGGVALNIRAAGQADHLTRGALTGGAFRTFALAAVVTDLALSTRGVARATVVVL